MGMDKPDVRFVVRYDVSDSLNAYDQAIGRAGWDGDSAFAVLLFSEQDLNLTRFFLSGGRLTREVIAQLAAAHRPVRSFR